MITFVFLGPNFKGDIPEGPGCGVIISGSGLTWITFPLAHSNVANLFGLTEVPSFALSV